MPIDASSGATVVVMGESADMSSVEKPAVPATPARPRSKRGVPEGLWMRCDGCGAALSYSAERRAPACGFCGATLRIETPVDPIEQAQVLLPFRVDETQARAALREWLGKRGFFAPGDLSRASSVDAMKPIRWAGWIAEADTLVSYTGDSDAGRQRSAWAPHAGCVPLLWQSRA